MKTKNNNTKSILLKSGTIIISFILISFAVNAQEIREQFLTGKDNTVIIADAGSDSHSNTGYPAKKMSTVGIKTFNCNFIHEKDKSLGLEPWMTSEAFLNNFSYQVHYDVDPGLELEDWMTDSRCQENRTINIRTERDRELNLENWMVNNNIWKI